MRTGDFPGWHEAVGLLVHQAAEAESAMADLARRLSGLDDAAGRQLLPLELDQQVRIVRNLLPIRVQDVHLVSDVLAWTHQVRKLYAVRTSVVHTVWGPTGTPGAMTPTWSSADASDGPVTIEELDRTRARLESLCAGPFMALVDRIDRIVGPRP